jgi:DNA-binding response OmpR family regulator
MEDHAHQGEVLVVEDTPASLKLLADLLAQAGYAVREAPDGELALWSAKARAPELILLDVHMPGIDGFEVCARLKADPVLRDIPVILLSAHSDTDDKVRGFRAGAIDFIGKPYQSEEVLARSAAHVALGRSRRALERSNAELTATMAQLRSTREDLRRAERLAALGAMVAGVAHQLNTPIGNCVLTASVLEERARHFALLAGGGGLRRADLAGFADDAALACALLQRNLGDAARLIDTFKMVASGPQTQERHCFELLPLLHDLVAALGERLQAAGASVAIEAAPGIVLDSYPAALQQVLEQLIDNALLHGLQEQGGTIRIEAAAEGGWLTLCCSDQGAGIAAADLGRVFEPFFTTRMGHSAGLGLHIVHNLATNVLGGAIEASSNGGHTRFLLRCPCTAPVSAVLTAFSGPAS